MQFSSFIRRTSFHRFFLSTTLVALTYGCGFSLGKESNSSAEKWSYQFTENGCDTGQHEYNKKEDYCLALRDEGANRGCAPSMRGEASKKDCR